MAIEERPRRTARDLVVGLALAAGLLAVGECALRLGGFEYHAPPPITFLPALHRFHPYWLWEPRPGAEIEGCAGERINRAAFRGPERPLARGDKLRIVTLGDSSTFGARVCWNQAFPALLEHELSESEVLNFGAVGFTAFQGEKLLAGRALDYHPDVVLAAFGAFNEALPAMPYDVETKFGITSRTSPWAAVWRDRLRVLRTFQLTEFLLGTGSRDRGESPVSAEWLAALAHGGDYVRNQSVPSFERSLEDIVGLARSRGARVALIAPPRRMAEDARRPWLEEYSAAIGRVAARVGAPCWDLRAALRRVPDADARLFVDGIHPSVAGHRLIAELLAENVRRLVRGAPDSSESLLRPAAPPCAGTDGPGVK